ncbi:Sugar diacid utilization regulator [Actinopolyspora alba]|uniref:Sugar diacid utilization regulator n=2 Tax=Actinopolyspora alba TaxID=673379 RepID=A0A1I2A3R1_9ACTN|nr:helix-turn-helix domain-containing protein [Actinopolyspora alba]SFE37370.1 Sugar diacid utilization regulator [Actinopolyspora alba]
MSAGSSYQRDQEAAAETEPRSSLGCRRDCSEPIMTSMLTCSDYLLNLFELLAGDGTSEQLAQVPVEARTQLPARDLHRVERAGKLALRLRNTLDERRRHESELAALFDTAGDLARVRDPDAVLRAIVHRARMLLGSHVAYLSLNDSRAGTTYMRVTDGCVSALFQQVRLGMGEGLGGLVAQTARPYATPSYFEDERFTHTDDIDRAVGDERLVAILGVPLSVGGSVIGVLYAADRSTRDYSHDEIALLSSLADHAAIAIDNSRLLEETRHALVELNTAHETIREHNSAMRRAERAHDRLTDLVLRGGSLEDIAEAVADVLGGGIVVHDEDGTELACAATDSLPWPGRAVRQSRNSGRSVPWRTNLVCAALAGPELLGSLTLVGCHEPADADRRLFERAGVVTALVLLLRRRTAEAEERVRGELITELLGAGERARGGLSARARRVGFDPEGSKVVLVSRCGNADRERLASTASRYVGQHSGLAGTHGDHLVLVLPGTDAGSAAQHAARALGTGTARPVTVGGSGPVEGLDGIAGKYEEACRCLEALLALGRAGDGAALAELGFLGVLLGDRGDLSGYVRRTVGAVLDYDSRKGTDLVKTLRSYFEHDTGLSRTARALHVHVNTVAQRLERVSALLGPDWRSPERGLEIQLALRLHRLSGGER